MTWKVLLALILSCFLYMVIGGIVFHYIESGTEETSRLNTRNYISAFHGIANKNSKFRNKFLKYLFNDTKPLDIVNHSCLTREQLEKLIKIVIEAYDDGILATTNATSPSNWDIYSAIFFSGTVITTIGYGHLSPSTPLGQAVCAIYAIFGIPLCLVMLGGIGERLTMVCRRVHDRFKPCKQRPRLTKILRSGLILISGIILFLMIPAAIFSSLEGWSYGQSLYFGVVSLTTVGFGDFVAGQSVDGSYGRYRGVYRLCIVCWIFIGLAWLASGLSSIQDTLQDAADKLDDKIKKHSHCEETNIDADKLKSLHSDSSSQDVVTADGSLVLS